MRKILNKIIGKLNIPLIIFLILVGTLLLISNLKNKNIAQVKNTVNTTVDNLSKKLNNAAQGNDSGSVG